jgi:hypothetical protein
MLFIPRFICNTARVQFYVSVENRPRPVRLVFGDEKGVNAVRRWRAPVGRENFPAVRDTLEFARLATKRWNYYRRSIATATTIAEFRKAIELDSHAEISFILLARAEWFAPSSPLGLAQCRRTWCNHFILEFLSVHPKVLGNVERQIRGVGAGLLCSLAQLAGTLSAPLIWGEATAYSAPFYAKVLGLSEIQDHFFIRDELLDRCRKKFAADFFGELIEP